MELTEKEWQTLRVMAESMCRNIEPMGDFWSVSDTLIDEEVELLRKLGGWYDEEKSLRKNLIG